MSRRLILRAVLAVALGVSIWLLSDRVLRDVRGQDAPLLDTTPTGG